MVSNEMVYSRMVIEKIYVKNYRELYELINRKLKNYKLDTRGIKNPIEKFKKILLVKLQITYQLIDNELNNIMRALFNIKTAHVFYRKLFETTSNLDLDNCLKLFSRSRSITRKLYVESSRMLRNSRGKTEALEAFKHGLGTLLSVYKRKSRIIENIRKTLFEIYRLPDVSGDLVIVITGMPQVGKSTLLSKLTKAKPEISPYPFTTKNIIVGHLDIGEYGRVVLVDAPGLLDRSFDEMNIIETRAVLAIKYLADGIIYLFDINPSSYYTFDEQIRVYESIVNTLNIRNKIVAINKIDTTPPDAVELAINLLREKTGLEPIPISALTGFNLDKLVEKIKEIIVEKRSSLGLQ
ncbi:MAG: GTPase [Desulfurococcaceae archaeon]